MRTLRGCPRSRWSPGPFRRLLVAGGAVLLVRGGAVTAQLRPSSPADSFALVTGDAQFRFLGRVVSRGTVASGPLQPSFATLVMKVDSVVAQPASVRPMGGRNITLVVSDTAGIVANDSYFVLANAIAFGSGLTLRDVARIHLTGPDSLATIRARLRQADSLNRRLEIRSRAKDRLVVLARVDTVFRETSSIPPRGDHDPKWRTARAVVLQTVQSPSPFARNQPIDVLFLRGDEAIFAPTPQLQPRDTVVLFLRPFASLPLPLRAGYMIGPNRFAVLHQLDARPFSELPVVLDALR